MNTRRDSVGRLPGNSGGPVRLPMAALRSRHITTERILLREGLRRERRDRYRFVVDNKSVILFDPGEYVPTGPVHCDIISLLILFTLRATSTQLP